MVGTVVKARHFDSPLLLQMMGDPPVQFFKIRFTVEASADARLIGYNDELIPRIS